MDKLIAGCLIFLVFFGVLVGFSALLGWLCMLIWNAVVAPTFGAPELSFWTAWGLWILTGLVTGRFRTSSTKKED
jgi:hypothetical protein